MPTLPHVPAGTMLQPDAKVEILAMDATAFACVKCVCDPEAGPFMVTMGAIGRCKSCGQGYTIKRVQFDSAEGVKAAIGPVGDPRRPSGLVVPN